VFQSLLLALAVATYGPYRATVLEVLAPEVLKLEIHSGPQAESVVEFHLEGIRGPRRWSRCETEQLLARDAVDFTRATAGRNIIVSHVHKNRSGTWYVGRVTGEHGVDLGKALVDAGYAVPVSPRHRGDPWCVVP
jgi:endonuclease YncB( thermonuclease family)